jgi:hypothetical protein
VRVSSGLVWLVVGMLSGVARAESPAPAADPAPTPTQAPVVIDVPAPAPVAAPAPAPVAAPVAAAEIEEEPPPPPMLKLERIPPRYSYEFAIGVSYVYLPQFSDWAIPPYVGFNFRGGWGKNFGLNRIGVGGKLAMEGPVPEYWSLSLEPFAQWDLVTNDGLALGASIGPAFVLNSRATLSKQDIKYTIAPTAALRLGWSQTWSRTGRRLFFYVEPSARLMNGEIQPLVSLVFGAGKGQ